jgi:hypothetical protein
MARFPITFTLSYEKGLADEHQLEFYDAARALIGFQRSLALTTHLVLTGEVITQAPSLQGAHIFVLPPEPGSWKITAGIAVAIFTLGTAPRDTPVGYLLSSAYDYVVSETLGFHVDYNKTLGQSYDELRGTQSELPSLPQSKLDSVAEKCEAAIKDMHRPIVWSETATHAQILTNVHGKERRLPPRLTVKS